MLTTAKPAISEPVLPAPAAAAAGAALGTADLATAPADGLLDARRAQLQAEHRALLALLNHDIRTPMNAIIGLAHLALREASDELQRQRLSRISQAAQQLMDQLAERLHDSHGRQG